MALGVVFLDVLKVRRLTELWHVPVEVAEPGMQSWVAASDVANVALEMLHVDRVEADDGRVQPEVGVCQSSPHHVRSRPRSESGFNAIQGLEQRLDRIDVRFLGPAWVRLSVRVRIDTCTHVAKPDLLLSSATVLEMRGEQTY